MSVTMVFKALMVLVVFLQLSCTSALPGRTRRHVDGMFTSEFSRARGSAAIRKIINSALAGKRDVQDSSYQADPRDLNQQADSPSSADLSGLPYKPAMEARLEDKSPNEVTDSQLCSAILDLLYRAPYPSQQQHRGQDY
ncbi:secretin [Dendropsophus ebraccatus]|uniref:secretin n=1 Tax=Dendropsophus ebraccatus TaxID=150705 RepID=UPI00383205E9